MVNAQILLNQKLPNREGIGRIEIDVPQYVAYFIRHFNLSWRDVKKMKMNTFWYFMQMANEEVEAMNKNGNP